MGLDMYLSARKYINKIDWREMDKVNDYYLATTKEYRDVINAAGLDEVQEKNDVYGVQVQVNCGYWRKVNSVHNWFVNNVQDGEDDCGEYYVSHEKLLELLNTCKEAYSRKDPSKIMPQAGFFFGSYDIDEYYWGGIEYTIEQLERISKLSDFEDLSFYYQSSW